MDDEPNQQRSRRALLAAAAGGAAALAATAALPLTAVAADPNDVVLGTANTATAKTSVTNTTNGGTAFAGNGTGTGYGLEGTSSGTAGVYGVSVDGTDAAPATAAAYTGVYGWAPSAGESTFATGLWGDSEDVGVYGTGVNGVWGDGGIGVVGTGEWGVLGIGEVAVQGWATTNAQPAIRAEAASPTGLALHAVGKVRFSRSGRKTIKAGKASVAVTLAGVTATSKVFAVLATNRSGRYVRAVVPASGKFTIYVNSSMNAKATISWFVLD